MTVRPRCAPASTRPSSATPSARRVLMHREQGVPLKEQAVLFRAAHHSDHLEVELTRRNIPFVKYGGLKFMEAAHVKDMLAILRVLENPHDEVAWFRVLQLPEGMGPATARRLMEAIGVRTTDDERRTRRWHASSTSRSRCRRRRSTVCRSCARPCADAPTRRCSRPRPRSSGCAGSSRPSSLGATTPRQPGCAISISSRRSPQATRPASDSSRSSRSILHRAPVISPVRRCSTRTGSCSRRSTRRRDSSGTSCT